MDGDASEEDRAFREEVRSFLDEKFDPELRAWTARQAGVFAEGPLARQWHHILYERGWIAPFWPEQYGGPGWTASQRGIFLNECARAGTPALPGMGLSLCGPVIMKYGTQAQRDYFLPRILSGEHYWCQGYSEPQAGSDLASLQTRAVRDGEDYVVDGSKIWTTHAQYANWIFLLVRTSTGGKKQEGISFVVSPIDAAGISVRPIVSISGEHELNQVFLDNVRIPIANRVGEENEGWAVAKYLLEFERGGGSNAIRLRVQMDAVKAISRAQAGDSGRRLVEDRDFRRKLVELEIELMATDWLERRLNSNHQTGASVGDAAASMKKIMASENGQHITELAMEALGPYAQAEQRPALGMTMTEPIVGPEYAATPTAKYFNGRAATIFGGSNEIQHNILARVALHL